MHQVQELQEDGAVVGHLGGGGAGVVAVVGEPVPKCQPVLLHQLLEAFKGAVVGVHQELSQRHNLRTCTYMFMYVQ